jgi:hypothetical protein
LAIYLLIVCLLASASASVPFAALRAGAEQESEAAPPSVAKFRKIDRQRLIAAKLEGKKTVMLLVASRPGENSNVVKQVVGLGASVRFREDSVDYLRLLAPVDRVNEIVRLRGIEVAAIDGVQMYDTTQELPVKARVNTAPPDANTPAENPFLPARDIGAPQFIRDHPAFDGRGVTIASLDGNTPDLLAPELKEATSLDGRPVPKIVDVINSFDPLDDTPFKIGMTNQVEARQQVFEFNGTSYHVASDGQYFIGFFDVAAFGDGMLRKYLPAADQNLSVLWEQKTNSVWVDTNQNQSFADEKRLTDFNLSYQPGVLGHDDPATPLRETIAFTILIDSEHKLIYFAPLVNRHTTSTASVAAGNGFFGGRMHGVAPGAQVASLLQKSATQSFVEGMILAIKNPKVDLVSLQWAALIPPQDGNSVVGLIFDRLAERYKKPVFSSADNLGPGISTNHEGATSTSVISVGGYISKDTWRSNFGVIAGENDGLINLSARGPRADGGFKPDLVAPVSSITSSFGAAIQGNAPFIVPAGYSRGMGTSLACPMASGAAALLISAAKQSGVAYDAERIRWALKSTARYLPRFGAYEQGSGLIDVRAAWEALKHAPEPVKIQSVTRVNVAVGPYLSTPYLGPGIYEREGWRPGQTGKRTITFTRTSGPAAPINYNVRWTGNHGTFSSPASIRLPLNEPVSLPVSIAVKTPGAHSAIINFDQPDGAPAIYQVMTTVIAADQFNAADNFTVTHDTEAVFPGYTSYFFNVPANTSAFTVAAKLHEGTVRLRFMRPSGKEWDSAHDVPVHWLPEYQTGGKLDRVITNPEPGVWQIVIENQNLNQAGELTADAQRARVTLTAAVFGAETQHPLTRLSAARPQYKQIRWVNNFASFNGDYVESPLGSAFATRISVAPGDEPIVYDVNVPPGTALLTARTNNPTNKQGDVDLYLYLCANGACELKGYSTRYGAQENITVNQPKAGKWKVVIDPVSIPAGALLVDYVDIFTHAAFGSLRPIQTEANFGANTITDVSAVSRIDALPAGNRRIVGLLQVMSRDPYTVQHEYNPTSKKVEPIKERFSFAETVVWRISERGFRDSPF